MNEMEVRKGISIDKKVMNNLLLTKKRAQKAERLRKAQLATFKKGVFTFYKPSFLKKRQIQASEDISAQDS